jgi:probable F420-dependent oxidoreductase
VIDIYTLLPYKLAFPPAGSDSQTSSVATRDLAQALEAVGVTGIVVGDHIVDTGWRIPDHPQGGPWPDAFTTLAYAAAVTSRVRIGTRVLILPYRQPFHVAHAVATLDRLSNGRAVFGAAAGYAEIEFGAFGIPLAERSRMADEYLRIITALWEAESIDFEGQYYTVQGVGLLLRPIQQPRPPIWVGGFSHRAARRAVELGDAWTPNCYTYQPQSGARTSLTRQELIAEVQWANAERLRRNRPPLQYVVSSGPHLTVTDTPQHAGRRQEEITNFTGSGTPAELADEYRVFRDAGATAFYIQFDGKSIDEYLKNASAFMSEVVPMLG